jgi:hypothetical protein
MSTTAAKQTRRVIHPDQQATGAFDGGRITEIKPIGFPGEGGAVDRVGPLFYWAWATSEDYGLIGMHPHQGFEIVSYVIAGELGHRDSLGTQSRVGQGGVQVIQAGAGVSHQEEMLARHTEFFQIWFEPNLREAVKRPPQYHEFQANAFLVETNNGVKRRLLLGPEGPLNLVTDSRMEHVVIEPNARYETPLQRDRQIAAVVINGTGEVRLDGGVSAISKRDFVILDGESRHVEFAGAGDAPLELMIVDVLEHPGYELYDKRRR